jgi:hypothetical protein
VATCIKATLHHLSDLVQQGAAIQLDLGVGALTIRGGRADFAFRAGLQAAAADVGPSAASVGAPLTAEAVQHLTDALGSSGVCGCVGVWVRGCVGVCVGGGGGGQSRLQKGTPSNSTQPT